MDLATRTTRADHQAMDLEELFARRVMPLLSPAKRRRGMWLLLKGPIAAREEAYARNDQFIGTENPYAPQNSEECCGHHLRWVQLIVFDLVVELRRLSCHVRIAALLHMIVHLITSQQRTS